MLLELHRQVGNYKAVTGNLLRGGGTLHLPGKDRCPDVTFSPKHVLGEDPVLPRFISELEVTHRRSGRGPRRSRAGHRGDVGAAGPAADSTSTRRLWSVRGWSDAAAATRRVAALSPGEARGLVGSRVTRSGVAAPVGRAGPARATTTERASTEGVLESCSGGNRRSALPRMRFLRRRLDLPLAIPTVRAEPQDVS